MTASLNAITCQKKTVVTERLQKHQEDTFTPFLQCRSGPVILGGWPGWPGVHGNNPWVTVDDPTWSLLGFGKNSNSDRA